MSCDDDISLYDNNDIYSIRSLSVSIIPVIMGRGCVVSHCLLCQLLPRRRIFLPLWPVLLQDGLLAYTTGNAPKALSICDDRCHQLERLRARLFLERDTIRDIPAVSPVSSLLKD